MQQVATQQVLHLTTCTTQDIHFRGIGGQVNSLTNDKDGMEMRDEIVMVHENDVFVDVGQSDVDEQGGYDAHMLHDMTPTQSMTHAMWGR